MISQAETENILAQFYDRLFRSGIAEVSNPCVTSLSDTRAINNSPLDQVLLNRIKWRVDELPGNIALTTTESDLTFCRELSRRYYQVFFIVQMPTQQQLSMLIEQCQTPLSTENECQIVAADAICYDGFSLLQRIERAARAAQAANSNERAEMLLKLAELFTEQLCASPLTLVRELAQVITFSDIFINLLQSQPVLRREVADHLALPGNKANHGKVADQMLDQLEQRLGAEFGQYVRKLRNYYRGEGEFWTQRFESR